MATTPRGIRRGEGGTHLPALEALFNDLAADMAALFETLELDDNQRRHRASRAVRVEG